MHSRQQQPLCRGKKACSSLVPSRAPLRVTAVVAAPKAAAAKASASASVPSPEVAKDLYYDMLLGREFEEMCAQMYYRGKMFGFVHLYCGQVRPCR